MSTSEDRFILAIMEKARNELGEFCNAVLIVVSYEKGEKATLQVKSFGPPSHSIGLAHYAIFEAQKSYKVSTKCPSNR
jgi:hypothetical protein